MKKTLFTLTLLIAAGSLLFTSCKKTEDSPDNAVVPTLTTSAATAISGTKATSGGNISSDGGATITARGVCWSTGQTPTISDSKTSEGTGTGAFTSNITGLTSTTTFYVRAYATNSAGTAYGEAIHFTTTAPGIGDNFQGGKIAYILQSGDPGYIAGQTHGLIAAPSDQSAAIAWYNGSYIVTGATATALGTGNANTTAIVNAQGAGSYAAKLCSDLVLGGYSDWYLPSREELIKLYDNRVAIGGFSPLFYWCSTEKDVTYAYIIGFNGGYMDNNKNLTHPIRAIRTF
jgi:hypothetical protein